MVTAGPMKAVAFPKTETPIEELLPAEYKPVVGSA